MPINFPDIKINNLLDNFSGKAACYIKDVNTGAVCEHNGDMILPYGSGIKLPFMVELFRQVDAGRMDLSKRLKTRSDISRHGSGVLNLLQDSPELSLFDYCRLMMGVSDNIATDMVLHAIGIENVTLCMKSLGLDSISAPFSISELHYAQTGMEGEPYTPENDKLLREKMGRGEYIEDGPAFACSEVNNVSSTKDMVTLLELILDNEAASEKSCTRMLGILKTCKGKDKIPRFIEQGIEVAHKTGGSHRISTDSGIIFTSKGNIIISVALLCDYEPETSKEIVGTDERSELIGTISKLAVEAVDPLGVK